MSNDIVAVVCIPSFRRPEGLRRTLQSLDAQKTDFPFAIAVIDNDAGGQQALAEAEAFFARTGRAGVAAVEAQQGNVHAINAVFALARTKFPQAKYLLMIDDDEAASPTWLAAMAETAERYTADIVGGPVAREFDSTVSAAIRAHPLFGSIDARTGPIDIIHGTGNCLIRRDVFERLDQPLFDVQFNFLGGGDMDFFSRARRAGLRFAWCEEAVITEFVSGERLSPRWLMARSIRTGTINYTMDRLRVSGWGQHALLVAKNAISLGLSIPRMALVLLRTGRFLSATHPPLMSLGRILGSLGIVPTPYRGKPSGSEGRGAPSGPVADVRR
ncbi:MAG TPA: glycosyltransferase [Pelagibacterium sp.]|uniref:glycosyltransferase family 2 protein n=1 Tax=Pelagibacterium sp. TaxID=1967288 RepID=UPI002C121713|nr:glycosyltransferase [Pelagibacterium sp.]HWJ87741.1 glycosyltransferase [Pelagibacterium sp.]